MAKGNANKVNSLLAEMAFETGKDRNSLYSECVRLFYRSTGKLSCGFDAKDLVAYLNLVHPNAFTNSGKRIVDEENVD